MQTDQEWEEWAQSFYRVLDKLDLDDLKTLTHIFECYPSYAGEVDKELCMEYLWTKFRDWQRATDAYYRVNQALDVLRLR